MIRLFTTLFFLFFAPLYALPLIVAHRGGGENFPENTLFSFSKCLEMGCDALEVDVQVTKDGVVVVYHPSDLKQWTDGSGRISDVCWEEIRHLTIKSKYSHLNLKIPTLLEVLEMFPKRLIIVDMKSLPAKTLVAALIEAISDEESPRLLFYSTNSEHIELINRYKPHWNTFEKRDTTRQRLLELNQTGNSKLPLEAAWAGFELKRKMRVTESFQLGEGTSSVEFHLWNPHAISELRKSNVHSVLFGINKKEDWEEALKLDVDAIYTDNPIEILKLKNSTVHLTR